MKRWSRLLVLLLAVLLIGACDSLESLRGSGNVISETREVRGFHAVKLLAIGDVTIDVTGEESLVIEAEDNILEKIESEVRDGVLELRIKSNINVAPTRSIRYQVTAAELTSIEVEGAGNITVTGLDTNDLAVRVAGVGDVTLAGTAAKQTVTIDGGGAYNAYDLASEKATVTVNGAASISVNVADELDVIINGAGSVTYMGDPHVRPTINGVGSVKAR